jgi:hypothetical protein
MLALVDDRSSLVETLLAGVTKDDKFIDIGSGLGTVVLQMAATTGCQATVGLSLGRIIGRWVQSVPLLGQCPDISAPLSQNAVWWLRVSSWSSRASTYPPC